MKGQLPRHMELMHAAADAHMPHRARALWNVLSAHSNSQYRAWPSLRTLARLSGQSRRTVQRGLNDLESAGWLNREYRYDAAGGRQTTTIYCLRAPSEPVNLIWTDL